MQIIYRSEVEQKLREKGLEPRQIQIIWDGMEHLAKHTGGRSSKSGDLLTLSEEVRQHVVDVLK